MGRRKRKKLVAPVNECTSMGELIEKMVEPVSYRSAILEKLRRDGLFDDLIYTIKCLALGNASDMDMIRVISTKYGSYLQGDSLSKNTFSQWLEHVPEIRSAYSLSKYAILGNVMVKVLKCAEKAEKVEDIAHLLKLVEYLDAGEIRKKEEVSEADTGCVTVTIVNDLGDFNE